jgi:hypothetical protein
MAAAEHTYSYLAPSAVLEESGRAEVSLATSGGRAANPYFFTGFLGAPRQTGQALLVVAEVRRRRLGRNASARCPLVAHDLFVASGGRVRGHGTGGRRRARRHCVRSSRRPARARARSARAAAGEARMAVAACLLAKSPELGRIAVDVLVAAIDDGRFDANGLGEALAWLADHDFAKKPPRTIHSVLDVASRRRLRRASGSRTSARGPRWRGSARTSRAPRSSASSPLRFSSGGGARRFTLHRRCSEDSSRPSSAAIPSPGG